MKPLITVDEVLSWGPCSDWTKDAVRAEFSERKSVSVLDALDPETGLSEDDRLWIGLQWAAQYCRPALVAFARWCAGSAAAVNAANAARAAGRAAYAATYAAEAAACYAAERELQCATLADMIAAMGGGR